jgi:hypothetical protein
MNGEKRYDYAMIDFLWDDGTTGTCHAMTLGFVRYNITLGIPTPRFTDEEELSINAIEENMAVDNNMWWFVPRWITYQWSYLEWNLCHCLHLEIL